MYRWNGILYAVCYIHIVINIIIFKRYIYIICYACTIGILSFFYFPYFFFCSFWKLYQKFVLVVNFDIYFCAWYIYKSVLLCLLLFLWYCYWTMRLGYTNTHNTYKNYLIHTIVMLHGFEYYISVSLVFFLFFGCFSRSTRRRRRMNGWKKKPNQQQRQKPMNIFITKTGKRIIGSETFMCESREFKFTKI